MRFSFKMAKQPLKGMSVEWLAQKSMVPASLLKKLAQDTSVMYKPTRTQMKNGGIGYREIDPPKKEYKRLLKRITKVLTSNIKHHPAAHGGVPGRSSFTSARPHCGARFIVTLLAGNIKSEFLIAAVTRSLDSLTAPSGKPTVIKAGSCCWISASTST